MKTLDLRWGQPSFMTPYWDTIVVEKHPFPNDLEYQFVPSIQLKEEIKELHKSVRNANVDNKHVVIGNGAKQLLYAAMYAMKKLNECPAVTASSPYFPRFPKMAELSDLRWTDSFALENIQIVTSPNNPDGKLQDSHGPNLIHDLVYNWPQYVSIGVIPENKDIMIFGLSKATGHASTRIGWALVSQPEIAQAMEEYIEFTTSGVSIEAQEHAYNIINHCRTSLYSPFLFGAAEMHSRWKQIHNIRDKISFEIKSNNGMFLWAKLKDREDFFEKRAIYYTTGEACGSDEFHARLNIGCDKSQFETLLDRLIEK